MAGVDITTAFQAIEAVAENYFKAGNIRINTETDLPMSDADNYCYGIDDVFTAMGEEGDYSMLQLTLQFMSGLHPVDLYMFFDELATIERKLFKKYDLDYESIAEEYMRDRTIMETSYIDFIVRYHNAATAILFKEGTKYTTQQMAFIVNRNKTLLNVLPKIGTRISRSYYEDYVVNTGSNEFSV